MALRQTSGLCVSGYIRDNARINIPDDIIQLCVSFYLNPFSFYKSQHGEGLVFDDDDMIVSKSEDVGCWSTCVLGEVISDTICDRFEITFKWIEIRKKRNQPSFNIGFLSAPIETAIGNWNERLGADSNAAHSKCFLVGTGYKTFYLKVKNQWKNQSQYVSDEHHKENDEFTLLFDFERDVFGLHHNGVDALELPLEGNKQVCVAMSIDWETGKVQITDWGFHKDGKKWK